MLTNTVNGIEVTKTIRAFANTEKAGVPIFGLTGHADQPDIKKQCLHAGMQEVYGKPPQPLILDAIFQRVIFSTDVSTKKESDVDFEIKNEMSIDWEESLKKVGGDKETAQMLLSMLPEDLLGNTVPTLEKFYTKRDVEKLRAELHRSLGAFVFLRLPKLERTLKEFQTVVKIDPPDFNEWDRTYDALKKAINEFLEVYKNGDY